MAQSFEEFVEATLALETHEELFLAYQQATGDYGYDRVVYTLITDHPSIQKSALHGVMSNYPEDWMAHYRQESFEKIDPVIRVAAGSTSPFFWSEIMARDGWTPAQHRFMQEGAEAGLSDGACITVFGGLNEAAGVGLASSDGGVDANAKTLHMLRAITTHFHYRYCELEAKRLQMQTRSRDITLSERETEVLCWCAEGKSETDIADILKISSETVKFHKRNIFQKLGVSDRTMAVLKAFRLGLINPYQLRLPASPPG